MKCSCCGKDLGEFTTDIAYELPDIVWSIPVEERKNKAKFNSDLCKFDGKYFIRGIAYVPIKDSSIEFGWGVWADVSEESFNKYLSVYEVDGSNEPPIKGKLANTPRGYESTKDQEVQIFFGSPDNRPRITLVPSEHALSNEQSQGITIERLHELNRFIS